MADVSVGNLYDLNKEIMKTQPILTLEEIKKLKESVIQEFLTAHRCNTYFMLLCTERNDYTVFKIPVPMYEKNAIDDIIECLVNRGDIQSIERTQDKIAIEFWVKIDDEPYCYYFFSYDEGVIDYDTGEDACI